MDPDYKKFGRGPRELTGAVDLINRYRLLPHHDFFCKRSLPTSISETHYLHSVVGDAEIRKGEGMQLGQLIPYTSSTGETNTLIQPFDLEMLSEAFQLREMAPVDLPSSEKGTPTIAGKSSASNDKEKKRKDRDNDKNKEHKKHKHRHKGRSKEKDKEKKKEKGVYDFGNDNLKGHHEKKRNGHHDANDMQKHKRSKNKSSKIDEMGAIR